MSPRRHLHGLCVPLLLAALLPAGGGCVTKPVNSRVIGASDARRPVDARPGPDGPADPEDGDGGLPDGPEPTISAAGPCERGEQCESGYCVDGVCCNVACSGSCVSCTQPNRVGECFPVAAGVEDPRGVPPRRRRELPAERLLQRPGRLRPLPPGHRLRAGACSGPRTFLPAGECDGDGLCVKGAPLRVPPSTASRRPAGPAA